MKPMYYPERTISGRLWSFLTLFLLISLSTNASNGPEEIHAISSAFFTISKGEVCRNEQITVTYVGTYTGTPTFTWSFGDAIIHSGSGQGPYVISYTGIPTAGQKAIALSVTDDNGTVSYAEYPYVLTAIPINVSATHPDVRTSCTTRLNASGAAVYGTWSPAPENIVPSGQSAPTAWQAYVTPTANTTYTITGTDVNGCPTSGSVTVLIEPTPTTGFTGPGNICTTSPPVQLSLLPGATLGTLETSPSGIFIYTPSMWVMPGFSSPNPNVYTVTNVISYPFSNPFGWDCPVIPPTSLTITMSAPSVIDNFYYPSGSQYCNTNSNSIVPTLNATNISGTSIIAYTSSPAGLDLNSATGAIIPSASSPGNYTVTVSITNGTCPAVTRQTPVTIGELKTADFSYSAPAYCAVSGTNFYYPILAPGATAGNFSGGGFVIDNTGRISIPQAISEFGYTSNANVNQFNLSITNVIYAAGGCPTVTSPPVQVTISRNRATKNFIYPGGYVHRICSNANYIVSPIIDSWSYGEYGSFSATPAGLDITSTGQINVNNSQPGTYTVIHGVSQGPGCSGAHATQTFTILPKPVLTPATVNACSGIPFSHTFQTIPVSSGYNVPSWTAQATPAGSVTGFSTSGSAAILNQTYTTTNGGSVTYNVTPYHDGCYGDIAQIVVHVYPTPVITGIANKTVCGNSISLNQPITSSNVPTATFSWTSSGTNGGISGYTNGSGSTITDQIANSGIQGVVNYTVSGTKDGCTGSTAFSVTVNPIPALTGSFSKLDPCPMETFTYTYSQVPGATYSQVIPAGYQIPFTDNGNPAQTVLTILPDANIGNVGVVATYPSTGCQNSDITQVNVKLLASIIASSVTVCAASPVNIAISSTDPGATISWSAINIPSTITGLPASGTGTSISGTPEGSGIATYGVYTLASNGCNSNAVGPFTVTATVNANPLQSVTAGPSPICENGSVGISVGTPPTPAGFSYVITTVPAGFVYQGSGGGQYGYSVGFKVGTTGGDFVVTSSNATTGCSRVISYPIVVIPAPAAPIVSVTATSGCQGDMASFTAQNPPGSIGLSWTMQGGSTFGSCGNNGTSQGCAFTFNGASGNLNVIATDPLTTCTATTPTYLTVKQYPAVTPVTPPSICPGTACNIALTSTPAGSTFSWTASLASGTVNGFSNGAGNVIQQSLTGLGSVNYDVTASNGNGCIAAPTRITQPVSTNTVSVVVTKNHPAITPQIPMSSIIFTATVTNGGTNPSYQWKVNGVNKGSNNPTYSNGNLDPDVHGGGGDQVKCQVTSNIACPTSNPVTSNIVTVGCTYCRTAAAPFEEVQEESENFSATVYPNPFSGTINIRIPKNNKSDSQILITNLNGVIVESFTTNSDFVEAGQQLPAGVYILKVISGSETTMTRIIKQ